MGFFLKINSQKIVYFCLSQVRPWLTTSRRGKKIPPPSPSLLLPPLKHPAGAPLIKRMTMTCSPTVMVVSSRATVAAAAARLWWWAGRQWWGLLAIAVQHQLCCCYCSSCQPPISSVTVCLVGALDKERGKEERDGRGIWKKNYFLSFSFVRGCQLWTSKKNYFFAYLGLPTPEDTNFKRK